ncbi:MAG: hypothetical protein ACYCOU_16250 [Sulfobacillus sp.]
MTIFALTQYGRDEGCSGKGTHTYTFVSLKDGGTYHPFQRPEDVGGMVVSVAGRTANSADRHSATVVECDLPELAVVKIIEKNTRGGSKITCYLVSAGALSAITYVGAKKNGAGWDTVVEIGGQRIIITG